MRPLNAFARLDGTLISVVDCGRRARGGECPPGEEVGPHLRPITVGTLWGTVRPPNRRRGSRLSAKSARLSPATTRCVAGLPARSDSANLLAHRLLGPAFAPGTSWELHHVVSTRIHGPKSRARAIGGFVPRHTVFGSGWVQSWVQSVTAPYCLDNAGRYLAGSSLGRRPAPQSTGARSTSFPLAVTRVP